MKSDKSGRSLLEFKNTFFRRLNQIYPKTEIDSFFSILIEEKLGIKPIDLVLNRGLSVRSNEFIFLQDALERLENQEPIQYITGKTDFFGLPFLVNENTLIPRPETEELVAWIIKEIRNDDISILDIGTGTGCIAIALAKKIPNAEIFGIDIDQKTLSTAIKNAELNDVVVRFSQLDILKTSDLNDIKTPSKFDIIVSNPPYVRKLEKLSIKDNVLKHEPHSALFVPDDNPLIFYEKIATLAEKYLSKKGLLFLEINQYLSRETIEMLESNGFSNTELRKDIFDNDRMIKVCF